MAEIAYMVVRIISTILQVKVSNFYCSTTPYGSILEPNISWARIYSFCRTEHRKCRPFGVKLPDFIFTIPRQHTFSRYSLFWATVGRCAENAADLPDHRFLVAIFLTDDITHVLRSCDDDDNEHVLLLKIVLLVLWRLSTAWCWPPSSPRSRASCFTTCLCLELVGETVCTWSVCRTIRTTATASTSGVRMADPTCWVT